jgi:hypothetical protein
MKRFLVVAALLGLAASVAYAAPPVGGKLENPAQSSANNPAKTCKKERADSGVDAFNKKYGTNHNLKNAFGKCVAGKSKDKGKDKTEGDEEGTSNAAKQCKKERTDMGAEAFADKYGTNPNKANAFGKCVSSRSKKNGESDDD